MSDLSGLLTSGGDERILLKDNGLNKNFINPAKYTDTLFRGSCTCNTLNVESYAHLAEVSNRVNDSNFEKEVERQRSAIKELAGASIDGEFEVFFAPSGTGLNYYSLLFASILNPGKPIHNLVTCPEELGSGTPNAASGRYFAELSQFGEKVSKGEKLSDQCDVNTYYFDARDENGNILNHRAALVEKLKELENEPSVIGNLVIGSKSGIEDNVTIIPRSPGNPIWVIDMCQLRAPSDLVNRLIGLGAMVMITGSKFYQAPPYCGALLVPKKFLDTLPQDRDASVYEPFAKVFSKNDIPAALPWMRKHFRDFNNKGLLLRWEAAIYEMAQISEFSVSEVMEVMNNWYDLIIRELSANNDVFELMPDGEITNKTIISFRLKKSDGTYYSEPELREVYKKISLTEHTGLNGNTKLIIGQPVKYLNKAFIRLALGSYSIRHMIKSGIDSDLERRVIEIIKEAAKNYEQE